MAVPELYDYNQFKREGRLGLGQQQAAALNAQGRATGGELVGLPGYAAGGVGPGYLRRLRRDTLRRGAAQIGSDFSALGGQQAGRESDLLSNLIQRRVEERYKVAAEKRARPTAGQLVGQAIGTGAGLLLAR